MKGKLPGCLLRMLFPAAVFVLFAASAVPAVLCVLHGPETVFARAGIPLPGKYAGSAVTAALFLVGALLFLLLNAASFYARAWVFYCLDKNQTRPAGLLRPSQAMRYAVCRLRTAGGAALWSALYFSPAAVLAAALYFFASDGLNRNVFYILAAAATVLAAAGAVFSAVSSSRYVLADYLLYLNPLMPPKEAVISSVRLTRGKLLFITLKRLSLVPWALSELLILPAPFAAVYRRFCAAALREMLFGEDKRRVKSPAVVFYISGKSRMNEV